MHTIHICNNYILKGKGKGMPSHKNTLLYFLLFISTLYSNTTFAANRLVYCDGCGYFEEKELAEAALNASDTLLVYNYSTESMNKWVLNSTSSSGSIYEEENELVSSKVAKRAYLNTANINLKNSISSLRQTMNSITEEEFIIDLSNSPVYGNTAVSALEDRHGYTIALFNELRSSGTWEELDRKIEIYNKAKHNDSTVNLSGSFNGIVVGGSASVQFKISPSDRVFRIIAKHRDASTVIYNIDTNKIRRGLIEALGFLVAHDASNQLLAQDATWIRGLQGTTWNGNDVDIHALSNFYKSEGATIESVCSQQKDTLICSSKSAGRADDGTPRYELKCTFSRVDAC